jgi:hypothetical protein
LPEFSRLISANIANDWEAADIDQKQRVQKTLLPGGLKYDKENGILNPGNDSASVSCRTFYSKKYLWST